MHRTMPLEIDIHMRITSFLSKLIVNSATHKLSTMMYNIIFALSNETRIKCLFLLVKAANTKVKDIFLQKWRANIAITSNSNFYKYFKTNIQQSEYL